MAYGDNLQRRIENASLYFQGGVRRTIVIITLVVLVLLAPIYFLGQLSSSLFKQVWFDSANAVIPKNITVNNYDISETQIVPLADGSKDLYVSVSNKRNPEIGYYPWNYTLQILNAQDQIISQETVKSYLLPDETKFIVARSDDPTAQKIRITEDSTTKSTLYNPDSPLSAKNPNIEIRQQRLTANDDGTVTVFAQFKNNDIVVVQTIDVLYIIRDTRQSVVGIGTFQFNGFFPDKLRDFTITYPAPEGREPKFLDLRWSVNYLDSNAVRRP